MAKNTDGEVQVGENLSEHLLDLIGGGVGPEDMFPDPGEPGYAEVRWTRTMPTVDELGG